MNNHSAIPDEDNESFQCIIALFEQVVGSSETNAPRRAWKRLEKKMCKRQNDGRRGKCML